MAKTNEINISKLNLIENNVGASSARPMLQRLSVNKGITIIALIITIILMLILASVTVNVAINGGLFESAGEAKYVTEIASEKDSIQKASRIVKATSKTGILTVEEMQKAINKVINQSSATAINNGDTIVVQFNDSKRYYEVDNNGKVAGPIEIIFDAEPGVLDGTGTEADPFVIMSIEDLVYFSQQVNGGKSYSGKYVALGKTLDFTSDLSYINPNTTEYDEYLGGTGKTGLKEQLINGLGFKPIGTFRGTFDGNDNAIKSIKIDVEGEAGVFKKVSGTIQNLGIEGEITSTSSYAGGLVSALISGDKLNVINCYVSGNIMSRASAAGGICGYFYESTINIQETKNFATITTNPTSSFQGAGGFLGGMNGGNVNIKNSSNMGKIFYKSSPTHTGVGGFVGSNYVR